MISLNILVAISHWVQSRSQGANPDPSVVQLMPLMYETLDALHHETRRGRLPFAPTSRVNANRRRDNPDAFTFDLLLSDPDYAALRSILALAGDLIHISNQLTTLQGLAGLGQFISNIYNESNRFRDARNFFSHLDEHISNRQKHGINGPMRLGCGVEFTASATNNVYLIWDNNTYTSVV